MIRLLILVTLALGMSNLYAEQIELKIAYEDQNQPPYYFKNDGKNGVAVEMVRLLESYIPGIKISFVRYPWKRCLYALKRNEIDGLFKATYKVEREKIGAFPMKDGKIDESRKFIDISNSFFKHKSSNITWDGKTLTNFSGTVFTPRGYYVESIVKKLGLKTVSTNSTFDAFKLFLLASNNLVATHSVSGDHFIESNKTMSTKMVKLKPLLTKKPQYLMLSLKFKNDHPELAEKIWDKLSIIRKKHIQKLYLKYD